MGFKTPEQIIRCITDAAVTEAQKHGLKIDNRDEEIELLDLLYNAAYQDRVTDKTLTRLLDGKK